MMMCKVMDGRRNVSVNYYCRTFPQHSFYLCPSSFLSLSSGASKEIGTALTRVCLRQKSVETRLKTFASAIMDCLILPLQVIWLLGINLKTRPLGGVEGWSKDWNWMTCMRSCVGGSFWYLKLTLSSAWVTFYQRAFAPFASIYLWVSNIGQYVIRAMRTRGCLSPNQRMMMLLVPEDELMNGPVGMRWKSHWAMSISDAGVVDRA